MRYARDYRAFQLGITSSTPSMSPYAWRRDRAEDDPSWTSGFDRDEAEHESAARS